MLVGEKQMNRGDVRQSTDDNESYCTPGWNGDWEVYRVGSGQPAPDFNTAGRRQPRRTCSARRTPTGFNVVFCDGSVRFIRYSVSATTWSRACTRNDNQVVNPATCENSARCAVREEDNRRYRHRAAAAARAVR